MLLPQVPTQNGPITYKVTALWEIRVKIWLESHLGIWTHKISYSNSIIQPSKVRAAFLKSSKKS